MKFEDAQNDMNFSYFGSGTGALISGFVGLFLAFHVAKLQVEWFYPIMLMIIGVRYLVFNTLYGIKTYWVLGGLLMLTGMLCILLGANFIIGAFVGGVTEIVFSLVIFMQTKNLVLKSE